MGVFEQFLYDGRPASDVEILTFAKPVDLCSQLRQEYQNFVQKHPLLSLKLHPISLSAFYNNLIEKHPI